MLLELLLLVGHLEDLLLLLGTDRQGGQGHRRALVAGLGGGGRIHRQAADDADGSVT